MGAGKTCVGRLLARRLALPFVDTDEEIVKAAGATNPEIFARFGEPAFRHGERRVIARLLEAGPQILATGGGAFLDEQTRAVIKATGTSVWLRASLDILARRTIGRGGRPLLETCDPRATLAELMEARYPVYALADVVVDTTDEPAETTVDRVLQAIRAALTERASPSPEAMRA